jgi:hypothetical protein
MTNDPKSIEHSKTRSQDRGQPFGLEFFATPTSDEARYLGDPEDVEAIVREFCAEVQKVRIASVAAGQDSGFTDLQNLCARYGGIFMGQEDDYRANPFNSADGLGAFLKQAFAMEAPAAEAPALFLMHIAGQVMAAEHGFMTEELSEETAKFHLDAAIDEAVTCLLGLPLSTADDDTSED